MYSRMFSLEEEFRVSAEALIEHPFGPPRSLVVTFAPTAPRGRALDLGAGEGRESLYLAQLGFEVDAVDDASRPLVAREDVLTKLVAEAQRRNLPVHAWMTDFLTFNLDVEFYALILALYSLQYDQRTFPGMVRRVQQALVPGGRLILGLLTRLVRMTNETTEAEVRRAPSQFRPDTIDGVLTLFPSFHVQHAAEYVSWDRKGHPGAEYPHAHTVLDLVLDKPR